MGDPCETSKERVGRGKSRLTETFCSIFLFLFNEKHAQTRSWGKKSSQFDHVCYYINTLWFSTPIFSCKGYICNKTEGTKITVYSYTQT